ncbi:hypothetical protein [Pseudoalteromonas rubra]|uniref:Uncharacterized protein n=1 Tax=Pseudoalteromonas rubra TaxID=43658 RepID=A0A0U2Z9L2_9GAMM|nr:hypothetical protein [Pseudoalteromonas rubra]ALU44545.1 hypothetical protein AT705_17355 [Pseudoalteromonas rubra]
MNTRTIPSGLLSIISAGIGGTIISRDLPPQLLGAGSPDLPKRRSGGGAGSPDLPPRIYGAESPDLPPK